MYNSSGARVSALLANGCALFTTHTYTHTRAHRKSTRTYLIALPVVVLSRVMSSSASDKDSHRSYHRSHYRPHHISHITSQITPQITYHRTFRTPPTYTHKPVLSPGLRHLGLHELLVGNLHHLHPMDSAQRRRKT